MSVILAGSDPWFRHRLEGNYHLYLFLNQSLIFVQIANNSIVQKFIQFKKRRVLNADKEKKTVIQYWNCWKIQSIRTWFGQAFCFIDKTKILRHFWPIYHTGRPCLREGNLAWRPTLGDQPASSFSSRGLPKLLCRATPQKRRSPCPSSETSALKHKARKVLTSNDYTWKEPGTMQTITEEL